ncbi:Chondroitin sulfate proteoglycan 4 [Bagarius yarrelli]|uniref:Chondroitin sulfate proteoglycan 4 n=1 Tax=Bagarius yarrelli TaxID=175774 RepID=A0A556TI32_BAGYA|nr:Chondroitin sulfate proteoglycan 4 [Bagarius yarrelli]
MDTPPDKLIYNIEATKNGIVALKDSPDYSVERITQAQINNNKVIFIHKGSESGGFSFTVTDGDHTSPLHRFVVTVRQLMILMEVQGELLVFPGSRQVINRDILRAVTSEDGDDIHYSLVKPPQLGRLTKPNQSGQFEEISQFTQTELDAGAVYYEHQMPPESFWALKDTVELELSSPPAAKLKHTLPVTVAYYATHRNVSSQLWKNKGMSVVQGQSKVFNVSILDASNLLGSVPQEKREGQDIVFEVRQFPNHGHLTLGGDDLPRDSPYFMQDDINKGKLEYNHDDSGASTDKFSFRVRLNPRGHPPQAVPGTVVLEEVFLISIRQRDSSPPELVSLDLILEALQGSMTILSKQYLNTIDQDSTPDEVRFIILKNPTNGHIIHKTTGGRVEHFTQEEVNMGKVAFVSNGSLSDGFMEFVVSDGKHQTAPHMLRIGILAKKLVLSKAQEIQVRQGDDETPITEDMLKASTGGPADEEVIYKITTFPTRSRAANVSSSLNITVKPLVNIAKDPLLPRGTTVLVDRMLLDATPLANKTKTSPTFILTQKPKLAKLVRRGGSMDGQPVESFSQRDLDEGRVALEVLNSTRDHDKDQDKDEARFLLKAHGVPPAECILSFQTVPYDSKGIYDATVVKVPTSSANSDTSKSDQPDARRRGDEDWPYTAASTTPSISSHKSPVSRRNSLWAILIPILVILLLLLVAGVLAYYLVRRNKTGKHNVQNASSKPKNGEVAQETFRKTDPANNIAMTNIKCKDADPELLQHCRTTNPALKKNQYWSGSKTVGGSQGMDHEEDPEEEELWLMCVLYGMLKGTLQYLAKNLLLFTISSMFR